MILGRVVGEIWATRKHPGLAGAKLLVVQPHLWYGPPFEVAHVVAIDTLGAGQGEDVLVCLGEPARQWLAQSREAAVPNAVPDAVRNTVPGYGAAAWLPVEAAVMAIVDRVHVSADGLPGRRPLRFIGPAPEWAPAAVDPRLLRSPSPSSSGKRTHPMKRGLVVGEIWATRKVSGLLGRQLKLIVEYPDYPDPPEHPSTSAAPAAHWPAALGLAPLVVAVDTLDVRAGQEVLIAYGSGARNVLQPGPDNRHELCDAAVALLPDPDPGPYQAQAPEAGPGGPGDPDFAALFAKRGP